MDDKYYYLREGFDPNKETIYKLTRHITTHTNNQVSVPSHTKKARVIELFTEHVYSNRVVILAEIEGIRPSSNNIEDAKTRERPSRASKTRPSSSSIQTDLTLDPPSPARPRTRSRSPLRLQAPEPAGTASPRKRRTRAEALKEAIEERPELEAQIMGTKTSTPSKTKRTVSGTKKPDPTAALLLREAKAGAKSAETEAEPAEPKTKAKREKSEKKPKAEDEETKKPKKSKKSKTEEEEVKKSKKSKKSKTEDEALTESPRKRKSRASKSEVKDEDEETSFTSDNVFQTPGSTDFKRKRRDDPEDAALERPTRRRDVAPHKNRHSEAPQLPQNAQAVFSDAPDLHAPANLTQEPFNISYGESNDTQDETVNNVLQMPDVEELSQAVTSTPAHKAGSSWLPTLDQVQKKVGTAVKAVHNVESVAEQFAKEMDGDFDTTRLPSTDPENTSTDKEASDEDEAPKQPWYKFELPEVHLPKPRMPEIPRPQLPNIPKPQLPTVAWKQVAKNALTYTGILIGSIATISIILFSGYLLYWVRDQKLSLGYCNDVAQVPVDYPEFLSTPIDSGYPVLEEARAQALKVFEMAAPQCLVCPENAKCTRYEAYCKETYVQQWPVLSYLGVPLAPTCVKDPVKLYKLNELKKRAVSILNQKRADYECHGANSPAMEDDSLKAQLREKKLQGVSDELFEELYEKISADFIEGDIDYPEITFSRQVHYTPIYTEDELTPAADPEPEAQETLFFESTSLAYLSFFCQVKRAVRNWTIEHEPQLRQIFAVTIGIATIFAVIAFRVKRYYRLQRLYDSWIDILQKAHEEAENDPTGLENGWLAEPVLLHQLRNKPKDRETLQKRIERNPSVRIREIEQDGEMTRIWEWVA